MRKLSACLLVLFVAVLLFAGLGWTQCSQRAMPMHQMVRHMMKPAPMPGMMEEKGDPIAKELQSLGCPGFFTHHAYELGLSDEQVADLKTIRWNQRKSVIEKRAQIQIAHVELEELLDQEPVNFDKVKAKVIGIGDLEQDIRLDRLTTIQKARKILTAEQLEKAKNLKKPCCPGEKALAKPSKKQELRKKTRK